MSSEIEETIKRLTAHKGVQAVILFNSEEIPIRTAPVMESKDAVLYPALLGALVEKAKILIKQLDQTNEFQTMRIRSLKNEILVYPEKEYTMVVVQAA